MGCFVNLIKKEAYFMSHCDNETCDLGSFSYSCPHCEKNIDDYEIWWLQDEIWGNNHSSNI